MGFYTTDYLDDGDELLERMADDVMGFDAVPSEERLFARLAYRLNAAMLRACMTRAQIAIVEGELLAAARELSDSVAEFSQRQRELLEEDEVPVEPELDLVAPALHCIACQRDMGTCSPMPRPVAEHFVATYKCPGCMREGR